MRKTRIVHICDKFGVGGSRIHGGSRLFSWWFPRFNTNRYDVQLVGLRRPDGAFENLFDLGLAPIALGKGKFDFTTISHIIKIVRREEADILHLHGYGASNFGRIAARMTRVKTIIHEHFVDPAIPIYQILFDYVLATYTDVGLAVSRSVRDFMIMKRHIPAERVKVVFNGAPLSEFKPQNGERAVFERRKWEIPHDYRVIGTIGRLDPQKGFRYFIDAAAMILQKLNKVRFMIVGDGPLEIELKNQCIRQGIRDQVIFTGYQSEIPSIQTIMDIQVFPSLWEGTPLTLFEAMAMRRPIVSTDVDGLGEVLRHGENALLVSPRDSASLAEAILRLLENPGEAESLASQAYIDSAKYDIQNSVDQIEQVYNDLMESI